MSTPVIMYNYHAWATQKMIDRLKELPSDVYVQEVQSVFPSISKGIAHIYIVDLLWFEILTGKNTDEVFASAMQMKDEMEEKSLEELETLFHELAKRYHTFFTQQSNLEETIVLDNPYAGIRETSLAEIVLHVVNHGTYHLGNISAMLRQMGHASTMTDYAFYWYQDGSKTAEAVSPSK